MSGLAVGIGALLLLAVVVGCARFASWRTSLTDEWDAMLRRWRSLSILPLGLIFGLALVIDGGYSFDVCRGS